MGVQNADFWALRCRLSFVRFLLPEISNRNCFVPERTVKSAIHLRRVFDTNRLGDSSGFEDCWVRAFPCLSVRGIAQGTDRQENEYEFGEKFHVARQRCSMLKSS